MGQIQGDTTSDVADVVIVGAGISGTLAATVLARDGHKVCLIDRNEICPPDFRAEHLDGEAIDLLRRLGLLESLTRGLFRGESVAAARHGRVISGAKTINYGMRYEELVNRARAGLRLNVDITIGRVMGVEASDTIQQVYMADGRVIKGRLLVLATGPGLVLCKQLGITRTIIREQHSLTFGFNIRPSGQEPFKHSFMVYQPKDIQERIDYLAAFTMAGTTRVNLFTYRDYRDPSTRSLIDDPGVELDKLLPGFRRAMGDYVAVGQAEARPIDMYTSQHYLRPGVVLIGDAFQMSCPATGMGMVRLLTDIAQLRIQVPTWLATPGMGGVKIAAYYNDPVKRACDAKALHDAEYRRAVSTETGLSWWGHRTKVRAAAWLGLLGLMG